VVIDPGHGGADAGARGSTGVLEKDVVMSLAQSLRAALERQGMRVVLTRHSGDNPHYDDRAATANAYRGAVTISLHVSSTGTPGTARAYYSAPNAAPPPPPPAPPDEKPRAGPPQQFSTTPAPGPPPIGLTRWEDAQQAYRASSKRLAEAVQQQIKERFDKSAAAPLAAGLRDLRSVAGAAIAVELASVSVKDRKALDPFLVPLAEAIARGIATYRGVPTASARTEAK
jgi:N-acetylmuramoyl-L-alanine amidase